VTLFTDGKSRQTENRVMIQCQFCGKDGDVWTFVFASSPWRIDAHIECARQAGETIIRARCPECSPRLFRGSCRHWKEKAASAN